MRREPLKTVVVEALVESDILSEEANLTLTPTFLPPQQPSPEIGLPTTQAAGTVVTLDADELFKLENIKLQMQIQANKEVKQYEMQNEREKQQLEVDKEVRLAEIGAEEKKTQAELQIRLSKDEEERHRKEAEMKKMKIRGASSQLPAFVKDDVDSYFRTFEKITVQNE